MKYKAGYKYVLVEDITIMSPYRAENFAIRKTNLINACGGYVDLIGDGTMTIRKGYAWDGPSGPTIDTRSFMRGSLFHDVSYQLIREGFLKANQRPIADDWLVFICYEDRMWTFSRWLVRWFLYGFGDNAVNPEHDSRIIEAP